MPYPDYLPHPTRTPVVDRRANLGRGRGFPSSSVQPDGTIDPEALLNADPEDLAAYGMNMKPPSQPSPVGGFLDKGIPIAMFALLAAIGGRKINKTGDAGAAKIKALLARLFANRS
jgi:hypothetical protein